MPSKTADRAHLKLCQTRRVENQKAMCYNKLMRTYLHTRNIANGRCFPQAITKTDWKRASKHFRLQILSLKTAETTEYRQKDVFLKKMRLIFISIFFFRIGTSTVIYGTQTCSLLKKCGKFYLFGCPAEIIGTRNYWVLPLSLKRIKALLLKTEFFLR